MGARVAVVRGHQVANVVGLRAWRARSGADVASDGVPGMDSEESEEEEKEESGESDAEMKDAEDGE